jgi:fructokinase
MSIAIAIPRKSTKYHQRISSKKSDGRDGCQDSFTHDLTSSKGRVQTLIHPQQTTAETQSAHISFDTYNNTKTFAMATEATMKGKTSSCIVIAAIECGGTSFRVAICRISTNDAKEDVQFLHRAQIYTSIGVPETLQQLSLVIQQYAAQIQAVGVASFGPVGLHPEDPTTYGCILNASPKQEWRNVNLLATVRAALGKYGSTIPIRIETDVNAPAMAEYRFYNASRSPSIRSCAYITVGTGVGVGLVVNDQTVHGMMHPEMGHVPVPSSSSSDTFQGYSWGRRAQSSCPFRGINTVEGLTSSVALTERYHHLQQQLNNTVNSEGGKGSSAPSSEDPDRNILAQLPDDDETWDHAAHVIASLCTTLFLSVSMERIVLGGGVVLGRAALLLPRIQAHVLEQLNGYLQPIQTIQDVQQRIVISHHGEDAGLFGAIHLAEEAYLHGGNEKSATSSDTITKRQKQVAFQYGLWHGITIGVIGTGLCLKYFVKDGKQKR